jgi:hypothetical protein
MAGCKWSDSDMIRILTISALVLFAIGFFTTNAYATHFSEDTTWQLVYLTDTQVCSNYDHQMTVKYDEITEKYFGLYEFDNTKYEPLCMNNFKFDALYEYPQDLDLIVLVYAKNLGEVELHGQKMGGVFTHTGPDRSFNNAIILCDCPNFYYSDPVWILSHELSHFVLYYLEFDMYVIEDLVHKYDDKYDACRDNYIDSCASYLTKIRVDEMAYEFSVMPPYEFAVGISKLTNNEVNVSEPLLELGKAVTKWWTAGKITEGDYSNALGLLAVQNQQIQNDDHKVLFKDGPVKDEVSWEEVLFADGSSENKETVMANIQDKLKMGDQEYQQTDFTGLPDWFKQTAQWWVDGQIPDDDFIRSVKYLRDSGIIRDHIVE